MLPSLVLVPLLLVLYVNAQRRSPPDALRHATLSLLREAAGPQRGWRRHLAAAFLLAALSFLLVAFARPVATLSLPNDQGMVILAIDVSESMAADDLKPTRLDAAKAAAIQFVERARSSEKVQIGVVAFSATAAIVQQPTTDRDRTIAAINRLRAQTGTAVGLGLIRSLDAIAIAIGSDEGLPSDAFNQAAGSGALPSAPPPLPAGIYSPAVIVLLSDGGSNVAPDPLAILDQVTNRGIRVFSVGIGTTQGAVLQVQGTSRRVSLDETLLRGISDGTHGRYFNAASADQLLQVYDQLGTQLTVRSEEQEATAVFAAVAAMFGMLAAAFWLAYASRLP